jgi:hypothetical protein
MAKDTKKSDSKIMKNIKSYTYGGGALGLDILSRLAGYDGFIPMPFKNGGRVKGCGIAIRGFGKAMKWKK